MAFASAAMLATGCSCAMSHGADAGIDGGTDATVLSDVGTDVGPFTSCSAPLVLPAGEIRSAAGASVPCRPEPALAFFQMELPAFSQMVPLPGAVLPEVIGEVPLGCDCATSYESTAGFGDVTLIGVAPVGAEAGYAIEALELAAACTSATVLSTGTVSAWARLDRAGSRIDICGGGAHRPLYFRVMDPGAVEVTVETDAEVPLLVGVFTEDCERRDACEGAPVSGVGPLVVPLPAHEERYLMVADTSARRGVSVRLRAQ